MTDCKHDGQILTIYGGGNSSGWRGLGSIWTCQKCFKVLWLEDDFDVNTPDEIAHNQRLRDERPHIATWLFDLPEDDGCEQESLFEAKQ